MKVKCLGWAFLVAANFLFLICGAVEADPPQQPAKKVPTRKRIVQTQRTEKKGENVVVTRNGTYVVTTNHGSRQTPPKGVLKKTTKTKRRRTKKKTPGKKIVTTNRTVITTVRRRRPLPRRTALLSTTTTTTTEETIKRRHTIEWTTLEKQQAAENIKFSQTTHTSQEQQEMLMRHEREREELRQKQTAELLQFSSMSQKQLPALEEGEGVQRFAASAVSAPPSTLVASALGEAMPEEEGPEQSTQKANTKKRRRTKRGKGFEKYIEFSDPQNRGARYCWKFVHAVNSPYNWGYLVHYKECMENPNSPFYQETTDTTVCTDTGGVEVVNMPFDGAATPFKVACVPRLEALSSDAESCWEVETLLPGMKLKKLASEGETNMCGTKMPWGFFDGKHVSSRFAADAGGVQGLYHCNGGRYTSATVLYKMSDGGEILGFGKVFCQPHGPIPHFQCKAATYQCLHYYPPDDFVW